MDKANVVMGIGDDAAVLQCQSNQQLVVSTDTLVEGTHFKADDDAKSIGHKALAVSFSDMAAMGVHPQWATLNLTLPEIESYWLDEFIKGFSELLKKHQVALVGGDTTQGPCAITVTVFGEAPLTQIKRRDQAKVGDLIAVTGHLGSASYALSHPYMDAICDAKLHRPIPRLNMIEPLQHLARAMIDVSDGLLADLAHICQASQVGALVVGEQLPVLDPIKSQSDWLQHALSGGDDYELCFTLPSSKRQLLPDGCTVIGEINDSNTIQTTLHGEPIILNQMGYRHFHS